jgi:uncharacterized membrane protein
LRASKDVVDAFGRKERAVSKRTSRGFPPTVDVQTSEAKMAKGLIQLFFAVLSLLVSVYCFLWIFSSISLAPAGCYGNFALFHSEFKCRQPYIAMLLWIGTTVAAIMLAITGYRNIKRNKHAKE